MDTELLGAGRAHATPRAPAVPGVNDESGALAAKYWTAPRGAAADGVAVATVAAALVSSAAPVSAAVTDLLLIM